ncbi:hypothetical protein GOZ83_19810 [Agrobacterium vitis]|uniref:hypothetical protein n=1 Tax=Agrobacterium vitis TaxID=373 RepID=UPI0012E7E352|nr:hypothetical protein [Agrobacterium vitis]MVA47305.1 hypothetical protein [Agrobacterium vitis]
MKPNRGRPAEFPIKKLIALNQEILDGVEAFRESDGAGLNQSEAIRHILQQWLASNGYLPK